MHVLLLLCVLICHQTLGAGRSARAEPFYQHCVTHERQQRLDLWNADANVDKFKDTMTFLTNNLWSSLLAATKGKE